MGVSGGCDRCEWWVGAVGVKIPFRNFSRWGCERWVGVRSVLRCDISLGVLIISQLWFWDHHNLLMMSVRYTGVLKVCRKVKMQCMAITYIFTYPTWWKITSNRYTHRSYTILTPTQSSHHSPTHCLHHPHPPTSHTAHTHTLFTPLTPTEVVV